jgi:hypothetical protein
VALSPQAEIASLLHAAFFAVFEAFTLQLCCTDHPVIAAACGAA